MKNPKEQIESMLEVLESKASFDEIDTDNLKDSLGELFECSDDLETLDAIEEFMEEFEDNLEFDSRATDELRRILRRAE